MNPPYEITNKEVIIDTIPFSYLLMGIHHVKTNQRIKAIANLPFEENKAILLASMLRDKIKIITPQVLAETSNHIKKDVKSSFLSNTRKEILECQEEFVKKEILLDDPSLFRFGITDISLLKVGNNKRTLVTGEERRELDNEYTKLHQGQVINVQDVFLRFENLGIR